MHYPLKSLSFGTIEEEVLYDNYPIHKYKDERLSNIYKEDVERQIIQVTKVIINMGHPY